MAIRTILFVILFAIRFAVAMEPYRNRCEADFSHLSQKENKIDKQIFLDNLRVTLEENSDGSLAVATYVVDASSVNPEEERLIPFTRFPLPNIPPTSQSNSKQSAEQQPRQSNIFADAFIKNYTEKLILLKHLDNAEDTFANNMSRYFKKELPNALIHQAAKDIGTTIAKSLIHHFNLNFKTPSSPEVKQFQASHQRIVNTNAEVEKIRTLIHAIDRLHNPTLPGLQPFIEKIFLQQFEQTVDQFSNHKEH